MGQTSDRIFDVSQADFEEKVLRGSDRRTVVVDFWAPWCAPCRMLGPVLEKIVESLGDRAALARINVDENQALAAEFGVMSIPAVKIFRGGGLVAEFVGAKSEQEIRRTLEPLVPNETDDLIAEADRLLAAGKSDEAEEKLRQALSKSPDSPDALVNLAQIAAAKQDWDEARRLASAVQEGTPQHDKASALLARLDFLENCRKHSGSEACRKMAQQNPGDLDARFALASCLASEQDYERALEELFSVIKADKNYRDGAAKDAMVRIFSIIGRRNAVSDKYRGLLATALY